MKIIEIENQNNGQKLQYGCLTDKEAEILVQAMKALADRTGMRRKWVTTVTDAPVEVEAEETETTQEKA